MKNQGTLVLIKPDGIKKSLTGNVITRFSESKLVIIGSKIVSVTEELAREHYAALVNEPFFPALQKYICGELHTKRVMALVYYGENAISKVRTICGATNPEEAAPDSIRGAYGRITTDGTYENVVHASANEEDAEREIKLWFEPDEITIDLYESQLTTVQSEKSVWK